MTNTRPDSAARRQAKNFGLTKRYDETSAPLSDRRSVPAALPGIVIQHDSNWQFGGVLRWLLRGLGPCRMTMHLHEARNLPGDGSSGLRWRLVAALGHNARPRGHPDHGHTRLPARRRIGDAPLPRRDGSPVRRADHKTSARTQARRTTRHHRRWYWHRFRRGRAGRRTRWRPWVRPVARRGPRPIDSLAPRRGAAGLTCCAESTNHQFQPEQGMDGGLSHYYPPPNVKNCKEAPSRTAVGIGADPIARMPRCLWRRRHPAHHAASHCRLRNFPQGIARRLMPLLTPIGARP